jgi:hypothetical protein
VHRRPLGRPRLLAIAGAVLLIVGCLPILPWYGVGGGADLPATSLTAFGGSGILAFLAGLGVIAVVTLPYATDRPVSLDRAAVYGVLLAVAIVGLVLWPVGLITTFPAGLLPDRAPGLWVTAVGAIVLARAVFEMLGEGPRS